MINTDFHKIRRLPPYVFEQVNRTKAALRAKGADIIDLGMGNPDLPTPGHIVDKLVETARKPDVNGYSASRGIPGLRRALTDYYRRRFDVKLDKDREVIVTLGSKEGFANLAQAISAPGDVILAPDPSYPLHHFGFIIAGASIRGVPAHTPEQYLSNLGRAVKYSVPPPTAMVLCFPSNPTAAVCDLDFYKEAVKFAKKHDLWILSDLAYNEIYFDEPTPSILQVDGAKDVAVVLVVADNAALADNGAVDCEVGAALDQADVFDVGWCGAGEVAALLYEYFFRIEHLGELLAKPLAGVDGVEFDLAKGVARHVFAGCFHFLDDGFHTGSFGDEDVDVVVHIHDGLEPLGLSLDVDIHFRDEDSVDVFADF